MKRIILRDWEASAFYAGRLTQLRRPLNPQPNDFVHKLVYEEHPWSPHSFKGTPAEGLKVAKEGKVWLGEDWCGNVIGVYGYCPIGGVGSRLWVAETWAPVPGGPVTPENGAIYRAFDEGNWSWRSPATMPRWASRAIIELTAVRVERVQDVTEEEAGKCGVTIGEDRSHSFREHGLEYQPHRDALEARWITDRGQASWDANPWVWVRDVRRVEK